MTPPAVRFHLYDDLRKRVVGGRFPLLNRMIALLEARGFTVELCGDSEAELAAAKDWDGYSVVRMDAPPNARGVTFRRTYIEPFYHIETRAERWEWPVAKAAFDPTEVKPDKAARFAAGWRRKLFNDVQTRRDGFVYIPLQGRVLERRSFQACSPLEMIEAVAEHDPNRRIVVALHPNERYSRDEIDALDKFEHRFTRLSVTKGDMHRLLPVCDYVVTMNSSVAFLGHLLHKPAALFGRIDFHHIAANAQDMGAAEAIQAAPGLTPDHDAYLWWFLRGHAIHATREDAEKRIEAALVRSGWPL